ncbi:MAG: hypothetical protein N4A62_21150 [Marinisporobacter sp.]|nr:hypothetical protein [Marinisporobacter sp.]
MLHKFLEKKNIQPNKSIIKDIERLTKDIDTQKVTIRNKYEVFNALAKIFIQIQKHVALLDKMGKEETDYHKELSILEQFIEYLIDLYSFDQTLEKLIERQSNHVEFRVSNQTFVDDTAQFDEIEMVSEVIEVDEADIEIIKGAKEEVSNQEDSIFTKGDF